MIEYLSAKRKWRWFRNNANNNLCDLDQINMINSNLQKENSTKLRIIKQIRCHIHELENVNETIRLSIDKLKGVAYGKWPKTAKSRNKSIKWSKTRSKAVIKPTKMFILKLASKAHTKRMDDCKSLTKINSESNIKRTKNKSVLKYSRPIYERLQEKLRGDDVYQLHKTWNRRVGSPESLRSDSEESLYSIERKKLASKSRVMKIKTTHLNLSGSNRDNSAEGWVKCPTIEEDYVSSTGPKRKTKINFLEGKRKMERIWSEPALNL